jgi:hypothetical protein
MASLGQLTAGIAREIENPLNFVNNFASLSVDLLDELKQTVGCRVTYESLHLAGGPLITGNSVCVPAQSQQL